MRALAGETILFVAPRFFGYERDIAAELTRRGATVDVLIDRPFETPLMKGVTRHFPKFVIPSASRLYARELERFGRSSYSRVLVINGQTLSAEMLAELRSTYPRAAFVLYMWDSFRNRRAAINNLKYFEDCLSFDHECCKTYGLRFRPLFFSPGFEGQPAEGGIDYDLSFIGTAHTDRYAIVSKIARILGPGVRFYRYLYLQAPWVFHAYRALNRSFNGARIQDFKFSSLSRAEVLKIFFSSRAILDIEHPKQTGLTIRTLEALGAGKKLATTNTRAKEYDFYRPENIHIIDRKNPRLTLEFLNAPYARIPEAMYVKYSLRGWVDEVLRNTGAPPGGAEAQTNPALGGTRN